MSTLVRLIINSRYRGGHPRTYLPLGTAAVLNPGNQWAPTYLDQVRPAFVAWLLAIVSAAYTITGSQLALVVPRYTYTITDDTVHKKYVRERTGLLNVYTVTDYQPQAQMASQRRRMTIG
jgi:hypothetical protein